MATSSRVPGSSMPRVLGGLRARLLLLVLAAGIPALGLVLDAGRRQRDLAAERAQGRALELARLLAADQERAIQTARHLMVGLARSPSVRDADGADRKSTRLNSSHANISYAVFCLK